MIMLAEVHRLLSHVGNILTLNWELPLLVVSLESLLNVPDGVVEIAKSRTHIGTTPPCPRALRPLPLNCPSDRRAHGAV